MPINWNQARERVEKLPFIFILLGIAIFFWVNGPAFFSTDWSTRYAPIIPVYISMFLIFVVFAKKKVVDDLHDTLTHSVSKYMTGFFSAFVLLTVFGLLGLLSFGKISPDLIWPTLIFQICVVGVAEEAMFRGVLTGYLGIFASSALFALWHFAAYGLQWEPFSAGNMLSSQGFTALLVAFIFGCIMGYLVIHQNKRFGLPGAMAAHACYNLVLLGVMVI